MDMAMGQEDRHSLTSLLEEDRERMRSQIEADRSVENTSKVLEKETDRLLMRYSQEQVPEVRLLAARHLLQAVRTSLPVIETISDVEVWQKETPEQQQKRSPAGILFLASGIALTVVPSLLHPGTILCALIGAVCLGIGGFLLGRKETRERSGRSYGNMAGSGRGSAPGTQAPGIQKKYLVDPDGVYHLMKAAVITVDHSLDSLPIPVKAGGPAGIKSAPYGRHSEAGMAAPPGLDRSEAGMAAPPGFVRSEAGMAALPGLDRPAALQDHATPSDLDFYGELLESSYSIARQNLSDRTAREQIENLRYFLHGKGIEAVDYDEKADRAWFDFLPPGGGRMTLRPALMKEGKVLKRGLASEA